MEPALKQRLIGAAVLVALAVIFLPMLIKGPAPESGVSDVSLDLPAPPGGEFETRELPLVAPAGSNGGSVTGLGNGVAVEGDLPTVETGGQDTVPGDDMMPATTAGGDYAVSFGSYASADDARRVVQALRASQLPGYQEATTTSGRTLYRVRIGPYESRPTAEAARLRAAHVRDDVGSRVVVLDATAETASASVARPADAESPVSQPAPLPEDAPVASKPEKPAASTVKPAPVEKPVAKAPVVEPAATPQPAAADVGFAVQLGAFSGAADAAALRDRARALGFSAFVEQVRTDKGTLNRVQVGPAVDRAAADRLRDQVAAKMGITGFVHSHP